MHYWSHTMGTFYPKLTSPPKYGWIYMTDLTNDELIERIITDHKKRSPIYRTDDDYRPEDYSDEIRIFVRSGRRWRTLINLQYEGKDDEVRELYES